MKVKREVSEWSSALTKEPFDDSKRGVDIVKGRIEGPVK